MKKWGEKVYNDMELAPFAYLNDFFWGDIVYSAKDRNHCIGISYCISSKTNIDKFKDMGIYMEKKDTKLM